MFQPLLCVYIPLPLTSDPSTYQSPLCASAADNLCEALRQLKLASLSNGAGGSVEGCLDCLLKALAHNSKCDPWLCTGAVSRPPLAGVWNIPAAQLLCAMHVGGMQYQGFLCALPLPPCFFLCIMF